MSILELPDPIYAALKRAADASGTTPADWIAARLPAEAKAPADPRNLADLFAGRVGRIRSEGQGSLSESCGEKFTDYLEKKREKGHL